MEHQLPYRLKHVFQSNQLIELLFQTALILFLGGMLITSLSYQPRAREVPLGVGMPTVVLLLVIWTRSLLAKQSWRSLFEVAENINGER
jgi:hypothetical protein